MKLLLRLWLKVINHFYIPQPFLRKQAELFYVIEHKFVSKVPFDLYEDKIIVLTWYHDAKRGAAYHISQDYTSYVQGKALLMHNLTDEDLTHLNLMGVDIKRSQSLAMPYLLKALIDSNDNFQPIKVIRD